MKRRKQWCFCHNLLFKDRWVRAGMTVEASYVMAIVLILLAVLIRSACGQWKRTVQVMRLHHVIQQMCGQEQDSLERTWSGGMASRSSTQVEGYVKTDIWEKEIIVRVRQPEDLLRRITIFEPEEGERQ